MRCKFFLFSFFVLLLLFSGCPKETPPEELPGDENTAGLADENLPEISCTKAIDCDDFDPSTRDFCNELTGECHYLPNSECVGGDGQCPGGCSHLNDSDCQAKTCIELGGRLCAAGESCDSELVESIDSSACCIGNCVGSVPTIKTCLGQGGFVCISNETCNGSWLEASDSYSCCSIPCFSSTIPKTCAELGGIVCSADKYCNSTLFNSSDTESCCTGSCLEKTKTCSELGGNICSLTETCSSSWLSASDSSRCCPETCTDETPPTCAEYSGYICSDNQTCHASWFLVSDSDSCCPVPCSLKSCSQLEGYLCGEGETCEGTVLESYDSETCCNIACTAPEPQIELSVGEISFNNPCSGDSYSLQVGVTLTGEISEMTGVKCEVYYDSQLISSSYTCVNFLSAETKQVLFSLGNRVLSGHTVKVVIDPENEFSETNESNNESQKPFSGSFDLYGTELGYHPSLEWFEFELHKTPLDYCLSIYIDWFVDGEKVRNSRSHIGFAPSESTTGEFFEYSLSPGSHELKVVLDPENILEESNESNNTLITTVNVE